MILFIHIAEEKAVLKPTFKGGLFLYLNGYRHTKHSVAGQKTRWRCTQFRQKCRVKLFTVDDELILQKGEHNHPPNKKDT